MPISSMTARDEAEKRSSELESELAVVRESSGKAMAASTDLQQKILAAEASFGSKAEAYTKTEAALKKQLESLTVSASTAAKNAAEKVTIAAAATTRIRPTAVGPRPCSISARSASKAPLARCVSR